MGAQARTRADLARTAAHRQRRHAPIAQGQGRGRDRLGRARAAVGRHPRRRASRDRADGVGRTRPRSTSGRASRGPGAVRTACARGPGTGIGQGPGPGVRPASSLDPARPAQTARTRPACRIPANEPGRSPRVAVRLGRGGVVWPERRGGVPGGAGVAAAARLTAPRTGRAQHLHAAGRRAVRHRRATVDGGAVGRTRADARRAARARPAGRAASRRRSRATPRGTGRPRARPARNITRRAGCGWTRRPQPGTCSARLALSK